MRYRLHVIACISFIRFFRVFVFLLPPFSVLFSFAAATAASSSSLYYYVLLYVYIVFFFNNIYTYIYLFFAAAIVDVVVACPLCVVSVKHTARLFGILVVQPPAIRFH